MQSKEYEPGPEHNAEALHAHEHSQELSERLRHRPERYNDNEAHQTAENARHEAFKEALLSKEQGKEKRSHQADRHNASHVITHGDREASFEQTMEHVRKDLPRSTRPFSRLIHRPAVERTSDFIGNTVARPNAILAGGISAFVVVLGLYLYAKYAGFALRGSETAIAFAAGWIIGILFDFFKTMITGKR
jgi:chromatin segregation and condensation protein Rec8/ScpA/Scc1 (kleisin family)